MEPLGERVLVFGGDSFTGLHLVPRLKELGYAVWGTGRRPAAGSWLQACDITRPSEIVHLIRDVVPDYILHLAGISSMVDVDPLELYRVNLLGAENVLEACRQTGLKPRKIIMAGSAAVYGRREGRLSEDLCPAPVNHYSLSKLGLEHMAAACYPALNIVLTRPFNYTGPGQPEHFVIPKIVQHYRWGKERIELGNIDVIREFNDVRMMVELYIRLLQSEACSTVVNLCSGRGYTLREVIHTLQSLTGKKIQVEQRSELMRSNEIPVLIGDTARLKKYVGDYDIYSLEYTLRTMLG